MKICPSCHEIVSARKKCWRDGCPVNIEQAVNHPPKLMPGYSGRIDNAVQAGLDSVDKAARDTTRRTALFITVTAALLLSAGIWVGNTSVHSGSEPNAVQAVKNSQSKIDGSINSSFNGKIRHACSGLFDHGKGEINDPEQTVWIDASDMVVIRNDPNESDFTVPMRNISYDKYGMSFEFTSPGGELHLMDCSADGNVLSEEISAHEYYHWTKSYSPQ